MKERGKREETHMVTTIETKDHPSFGKPGKESDEPTRLHEFRKEWQVRKRRPQRLIKLLKS